MRRYFEFYTPTRLLLIAFALMLPSCVELSSPISTPEESQVDQNLLGAWKFVDDNPVNKKFSFVFIGKPGREVVPSGLMTMVTVDSDYRNQIKVDQTLYVYSKSIADKHYATLVDAAEFEKDRTSVKTLMVIKYSVDTPTVWQSGLWTARLWKPPSVQSKLGAGPKRRDYWLGST